MPVHDVGYRFWKGALSPLALRWGVIAVTGIRISLKSGWVRRVIALAWIPVFVVGGVFFGLEQVLDQVQLPTEAPPHAAAQVPAPPPMTLQESYIQIGRILPIPTVVQSLFDTLNEHKPTTKNEVRWVVWSWLLMHFFRLTQGLAMILLLGIIVPPLISQDVRTRAFLLYYSRPINQLDYLIGKLAIPVFFLLVITTLPALCLYLFGVLGSPDLSVVRGTYDIPFKIVIASAFLVIPTSLLALMLSSVTTEGRYAQFSWYAIWGLGAGAWWVFLNIWQWSGDRVGNDEGLVEAPPDIWASMSLYHSMGNLQRWIFGLDKSFQDALPALVVLCGLALGSLIVLARRVSAPVRI